MEKWNTGTFYYSMRQIGQQRLKIGNYLTFKMFMNFKNSLKRTKDEEKNKIKINTD